VQHLNRALDKIRATEVREMKQKGLDSEILKNTKFCFLKNEANLTDKQQTRLKDVLQYDLKSVRAYLLKESFQLFWNYSSPYWAEKL
jgi:transposase